MRFEGGWGVAAYHNKNNSVWPGAVDILDQIDVRVVEVPAGDLVRVSVVVAAHLDDDQIGGLFGRVIEFFRVVAVECVGAAAGVGGAVPVPGLSNLRISLSATV